MYRKVKQPKKRVGNKGNKNKKRGTAFEYRVKAYYVKRGYIGLRARGSLGPADYIFLKPNEIDLCVQCKNIKSNYFDRQEAQAFKEWCILYGKRCVWAYNYYKKGAKRGRMKFMNLLVKEISSITPEYYSGTIYNVTETNNSKR